MLPPEFALSRDQLKMIIAALQDIVDDLTTTRGALVPVGATPFGGSTMGSYVRGHSNLAYDAISEALAVNSAALQHHQMALGIVDSNATAAEDASEAALLATRKRIEQQTTMANDCAATGAGDQGATCQVPTS